MKTSTRDPEIQKIVVLTTDQISPPLFVCGPAASSLDVAWDLVAQGRLPVWGAVLAASQSAGRGRMGRVWQSPAGHVYGALRLPPAPPFDGPGASLALAFLLARGLADFGWPITLKWPNDLIFAEGKAGGILLESKASALIAGVGLNLGDPPEGDWQRERDPGTPAPSALPFPAGPEALWAALVKKTIVLYTNRYCGLTMADLAAEAETALHWRGRVVTVDRPASVPSAPDSGLSGRIVGLGPEGHLRLAGADGEYQLWSGTLRLAAGPVAG